MAPSSFTSVTTTVWPRPASSTHTASPIPDAAPVTTTINVIRSLHERQAA